MDGRKLGALLLLAATLPGFAGCGRTSEAPRTREGSALSDEAGFFWKSKRLAPRQRFVLMLNDVVNESDQPVTIRSVEPLSEPDPKVARLESIELAPRPVPGPPVPQGSYVIYPPGSSARGRREQTKTCNYQEVSDPVGFVLPPSQETDRRALMVMIIRTTGVGATSFEVARVVYEQDGTTYEQDVRLTIQLSVAANGRMMKPRHDEVPCADEEHLLEQP